MMPFSPNASAAENANDMNCEDAWFPLRTIAITQISFESESHANSYHMDCSGHYASLGITVSRNVSPKSGNAKVSRFGSSAI